MYNRICSILLNWINYIDTNIGIETFDLSRDFAERRFREKIRQANGIRRSSRGDGGGGKRGATGSEPILLWPATDREIRKGGEPRMRIVGRPYGKGNRAAIEMIRYSRHGARTFLPSQAFHDIRLCPTPVEDSASCRHRGASKHLGGNCANDATFEQHRGMDPSSVGGRGNLVKFGSSRGRSGRRKDRGGSSWQVHASNVYFIYIQGIVVCEHLIWA